MSQGNNNCIPLTPVGPAIRDYGWQTLASVTTAATDQYKPLSTTVLTFENMFSTGNQSAWLRQVRVRIAAVATLSTAQKALMVYLYTNAAPTAPVIGTVYNEVSTNRIAEIQIPAANFLRSRTLEVTARVNPNYLIKSGTSNVATAIYAVVLCDESGGLDYDGTPTAEVFLETELCS